MHLQGHASHLPVRRQQPTGQDGRAGLGPTLCSHSHAGTVFRRRIQKLTSEQIHFPRLSLVWGNALPAHESPLACTFLGKRFRQEGFKRRPHVTSKQEQLMRLHQGAPSARKDSNGPCLHQLPSSQEAMAGAEPAAVVVQRPAPHTRAVCHQLLRWRHSTFLIVLTLPTPLSSLSWQRLPYHRHSACACRAI